MFNNTAILSARRTYTVLRLTATTKAALHSLPRNSTLRPLVTAGQPRHFERRAFTMGNDRLPKVEHVKIEETLANPDAKRRTTRGDTIDVHYRGTLQADGSEFDASYNRGQPLSFTVGKGQVIKGWDEGLLNMAPGEKRTLTIGPQAGYGNRAMGPIPAGSTLIFETELVGIKGVSKDEL